MGSGLRFYVASGLDNAAAAKRLASALEQRGHKATYDWTTHGSVFSTARTQIENVFRMAHTAVAELGGVEDADVVVVLLPCGRGTHVEMGAALAQRKPVILGGAPDQFVGLRPVSFYYHPLVERLELADEDQLTRAIVKAVEIHRSRAEVARG